MRSLTRRLFATVTLAGSRLSQYSLQDALAPRQRPDNVRHMWACPSGRVSREMRTLAHALVYAKAQGLQLFRAHFNAIFRSRLVLSTRTTLARFSLLLLLHLSPGRETRF